MKCPFCGELDTKVVDSRMAQEATAIRRRRECTSCERRFTTYERLDEMLPLVRKKDGRTEPFDRQKLLAGLQRACVKRPVDGDALEALVRDLERTLQESGEKEVSSQAIGQAVLQRLRPLDDVAYVRFASVYRDFRDIDEFLCELRDLAGESET